MAFDPSQALLQAITISYFCGWVWLAVSSGLIRVRQFAQRAIGIVIGLVLISDMLLWAYLFFVILGARLTAIHTPLFGLLLLFGVMAATYVPLKPWRRRDALEPSRSVRTARVELALLLIGLPLGGLIVLAPFGGTLVVWLIELTNANMPLALLIGGVSVFTWAAIDPGGGWQVRGIAGLLLITAALLTGIVTLAALVASLS